MPRYVARPAGSLWVDDDLPVAEAVTLTVHVEDRSPAFTGILDQHGVPIYRVPERIAFGFQGPPASELPGLRLIT